MISVGARQGVLVVLVAVVLACGDDDPADATSSATGGGVGAAGAGGPGPGGEGGTAGEGAGLVGGNGGEGGVARSSAAPWIIEHFAGAPVVTGDFTERTQVETPALVRDATACCAKYSFDVIERAAPDQREVGFVDVVIQDLESTDAYGGGIQTSGAAGAVLFLSNVRVEPSWPLWESYDTTNYDGIVLDDAAAIYAEDLTIVDWNADGAIDNKAPLSQFVRLTLQGHGNRGIRYWGTGPHYIVASSLENTGDAGEGSLLWFYDCDATTVNIYDSTFNGASTVAEELVSCDNGSAPTLNYLTTDPRTTGEMHEMFSP